ncbi:hypothetical protein [Mycolicibacterium mengxianglii]|uniref:hypothetical protein n=1 Tax=Mycolicibacterium mengxianglii TaxID=2736649 RepID=UPI0018EEF214|nr:hypothetical protein [Mycolicibacterium mengxianglii]
MPTAETLSALSGLTIGADEATAAVAVVTALAKSYTRAQGFDADGPSEDLEAVITTATLRLLTNPTGTMSESMGGFQVNFGNNFLGWSITELMVLNRYRDRAQ